MEILENAVFVISCSRRRFRVNDKNGTLRKTMTSQYWIQPTPHYKQTQNIGVWSDFQSTLSEVLGDFIFDCNFKKQLHFVICPNKRASLFPLDLPANEHAPSACSVLAFSCGRAKTIRKRYVWTRIFLKTEEINSFSKENGYMWTGPDSVMRVDYNYNCKLLTPDSTLLILKYWRNKQRNWQTQIYWENAGCLYKIPIIKWTVRLFHSPYTFLVI